MAHPLSQVSILGVAAVSLALAVLAFRAWRRTGNKKLLFVLGAFSLFFVKSVVTAYDLRTQALGHETIEMVGAMFDLVILLLLIFPFLLRRSP